MKCFGWSVIRRQFPHTLGVKYRSQWVPTVSYRIIPRSWEIRLPQIIPRAMFLNPLTPVPPITCRDEPWPFFHFWRHHFWPKLASFSLNLCRRKISFQWCPGQSDHCNGAQDLHKNARKDGWKTQSKISCYPHTWLLHRNNSARLDDTFLEVFLTARKPSRRSITAAKGKEKEKKERGKKFQTSKSLKTLACENSRPSSLPARVAGAKKDDCFRKLKDVGHLKILISAHARVIIS